MRLSHKKIVLSALLVVIIAGVGYRYSYLVTPIEFKDYGDWLEEKPRSLGEIQRYNDALIEAYEQDIIGGKTPEETLALWVEAVKEDDLEKASLYFLVDARAEALEGMLISSRNNVLLEIVGSIEDGGEYSVSLEVGSASFDTSTLNERIDGEPGFNFTFVKNPYTGIWKIEEF